MKIFAIIYNDKVHSLYQGDKRPKFAPNITLVEITGMVPQPEVGWSYDQTTQLFTPPLTAAPALPDQAYLYLSLGEAKSLPSLVNNGTDSIKITMALREKFIPASNKIPDPVPYDGPLKLKLEANGIVGDVIQVSMVKGVATFN